MCRLYCLGSATGRSSSFLVEELRHSCAISVQNQGRACSIPAPDQGTTGNDAGQASISSSLRYDLNVSSETDTNTRVTKAVNKRGLYFFDTSTNRAPLHTQRERERERERELNHACTVISCKSQYGICHIGGHDAIHRWSTAINMTCSQHD